MVHAEGPRVFEESAAGGPRVPQGEPLSLGVSNEGSKLGGNGSARLERRRTTPTLAREPRPGDPWCEGEAESHEPDGGLERDAGHEGGKLTGHLAQKRRRTADSQPGPRGGKRGTDVLEQPLE